MVAYCRLKQYYVPDDNHEIGVPILPDDARKCEFGKILIY